MSKKIKIGVIVVIGLALGWALSVVAFIVKADDVLYF